MTFRNKSASQTTYNFISYDYALKPLKPYTSFPSAIYFPIGFGLCRMYGIHPLHILNDIKHVSYRI